MIVVYGSVVFAVVYIVELAPQLNLQFNIHTPIGKSIEKTAFVVPVVNVGARYVPVF